MSGAYKHKLLHYILFKCKPPLLNSLQTAQLEQNEQRLCTLHNMTLLAYFFHVPICFNSIVRAPQCTFLISDQFPYAIRHGRI